MISAQHEDLELGGMAMGISCGHYKSGGDGGFEFEID